MKTHKTSKTGMILIVLLLLFSVSAVGVANYNVFADAFGWQSSSGGAKNNASANQMKNGTGSSVSGSPISPESDPDSQGLSIDPSSGSDLDIKGTADEKTDGKSDEKLSVKSSGRSAGTGTGSDSSKAPSRTPSEAPDPVTVIPSPIISPPVSSTPVSSTPVSSSPASSRPTSSSGSSGHHSHTVTITGVTLTKTDLDLKKGDSSSLTATVSPSNTTQSKTVTWSSSNSAIAAVDSTGKVTAVEGGTATITGKTVNGKTASCAVTVSVPATKIALNMTDITLERSDTRTLNATVEPSDTTDKVAWATSDNNIVEVDKDGTITAVASGSANITASVENGTITATCKVSVGVSISELTLSEKELPLKKGECQTLTATITPPDTTEDKTIAWSSSDDTVATVDNSGKITAVEGGTAIITALNGTHSAQCTVTVSVPATGISLDKEALTLTKGTTAALKPTITPEDATTKNVEWTSSDDAICSVEDGKLTANGVGSAIITAKTKDGEFSAQCAVTVVIPVKGIALNQTDLNLIKGNTETLVPAFTPADATDQSVTWASSDSSIATVDSTGKITAIGGGTATITVKTHDGGLTVACSVTVTVPVSGISLNKTSVSITKGQSDTLIATISPADATDKAFTWSSSDTSVAVVDNSGKVSAISVGTAVITATTHDGGKTAQCSVTVTPDYYNVTVNATNGSASGAGRYVAGSAVTLTETPNTGYHFVNWTNSSGQVIGTGSSYTVSTLNADTTIIANFTINTYTVTATAGTGGTVSGGGTYNYGSTCTLTAAPNSDYQFVSWSDGNTSPTRSFTVTSDISVLASFKISPVTWTYAVTTKSSYFNFDYYGNSNNTSSQISGGGTMYATDGNAYCYVTYTFKNPLELKAEQTIEIKSSTAERGSTEVDINGNYIHGFAVHDSTEDYIYTLPNDITVTTITATTHASNAINETSSAYLDVTVNSDIGSFVLGNSGTSENQ